jgi:diguanylate cyclase (GGDEF)-like protein
MISCVMLDVDHFKRFYDDFGDEAGDAVLREVGGVLKRSTPDANLAFRYGGEEFLIHSPGSPVHRLIFNCGLALADLGDLP